MPDFGIAVGRYVILPDHIHLFVAGRTISILENGSETLKRVLGRAIAMDSRKIRSGSAVSFDHLLRSGGKLCAKAGFMFVEIQFVLS
jgi:hypothetical protein